MLLVTLIISLQSSIISLAHQRAADTLRYWRGFATSAGRAYWPIGSCPTPRPALQQLSSPATVVRIGSCTTLRPWTRSSVHISDPAKPFSPITINRTSHDAGPADACHLIDECRVLVLHGSACNSHCKLFAAICHWMQFRQKQCKLDDSDPHSFFSACRRCGEGFGGSTRRASIANDQHVVDGPQIVLIDVFRSI
jgi:hypothetical protein